jgi:hypothetical protein
MNTGLGGEQTLRNAELLTATPYLCTDTDQGGISVSAR